MTHPLNRALGPIHPKDLDAYYELGLFTEEDYHQAVAALKASQERIADMLRQNPNAFKIPIDAEVGEKWKQGSAGPFYRCTSCGEEYVVGHACDLCAEEPAGSEQEDSAVPEQ